MADEEESSQVDVLNKLKAELLLDYCSYKLWNEFKRGSKLSKSLLKILKDLYISNKSKNFDDDLDNKLYCTRFICGLSEAMVSTDDGTVTHDALHSTCLSHADKVLTMYPFSATEKSHFKNTLKLQVILSAYRAGKLRRAKRLFSYLYPEAEGTEEYQEEIQEFFQSENESLKQKFLGRFPYQEFLRNVCVFLTPLWEKYDIPLLEKFKGDLSQVDNERIPGFFLRAYHDCSVSKDQNCKVSWESIIKETDPEIKLFKAKLNKGKETTINGKSAADQDRTLSCEVNEELEKSQATIAQLKKSSKQLNEFVKTRILGSTMNKQIDNDENDDNNDDDGDTNDDNDDTNDDDDGNISSKNGTRKQPSDNQSSMRSPVKRKWNEQQEDAEAIEWSLSEDDDHPTVRLPSPKRKLNVRLPSPSKRRKKNPWTEEEVSWLSKGVQTYGEGNWSTILRMHAFRFRTAVDLKDKWRNINKNM